MGPRGAGHYVKMVHNGIEYGDMQLIAEIYDLLHRGLGLTAEQLHDVFARWNNGELQILFDRDHCGYFHAHRPGNRHFPLVDVILDEAQQKGTGKWASQNALDIGAPIPTINAALVSRIISAQKTQRVAASKVLQGPRTRL